MVQQAAENGVGYNPIGQGDAISKGRRTPFFPPKMGFLEHKVRSEEEARVLVLSSSATSCIDGGFAS